MLRLQRRRFGFQRIKRGPWENGEGGNISAEWSSCKNQTQKKGCPLVPLRTPTMTATLRAHLLCAHGSITAHFTEEDSGSERRGCPRSHSSEGQSRDSSLGC